MTIIQLENLEFRYPGSKDLALKPVSLDIESGEAFALLGASGAGKTTLLNLLSGILNPSSGLIKFDQKYNPTQRCFYSYIQFQRN